MNHIPVEILHEIFARLGLKDRLKCMFVCRFWYDTLDRFTLLCNISVNKTRLAKLKDMLEHFPHRAAQVEYLTIDGYLEPSFDNRELCNMFPNLRELIFSLFTSQKPQIDTTKPFQFLHTTCKLEKLIEDGECEWASQLAMSNLCNNLKTLDLNFPCLVTPTNTTSNISQLNSMPVLEELRMRKLKFRLMELEVMHNNLPSLKRLYFDYSYPISGEMPQDIKPASLITDLEMEICGASDHQAHIQLYKYFGNKYSSVKNPIIEDGMVYYPQQTDLITQFYNEGVFPLYQKIGHQVETLFLKDYREGLDAFTKFDGFGMKLQELRMKCSWEFEDNPFIEELVRSQQSKYIQKLVLDDIIPESINRISNLEALETLEIVGSFFFDEDEEPMRNRMIFTQLINACPATLTTLKLDNIDLAYDGPASNITSVRHLTMTDVNMLPVLANIIETSFPKLSTLTLTGDITGDVTISLLNHNLKEVNFTAMYDEEKNRSDYSIESKCDDDIHCHTIKRTPNRNDDGHLYTYYSRDKPAVKREPSFALKFICPSVEQLSFSTQKKWEKY